MVLADPGPLLTPPSSSPPKTPHLSYSAQARSQNEEKNPPPKPYLPLQTRTGHRQSHRPHPMCKVDDDDVRALEFTNTCHDHHRTIRDRESVVYWYSIEYPLHFHVFASRGRDYMMVASSHVLSLIPGGTYPVGI
jgi:hypothetical protein